jgi:hypothetical protein
MSLQVARPCAGSMDSRYQHILLLGSYIGSAYDLYVRVLSTLHLARVGSVMYLESAGSLKLAMHVDMKRAPGRHPDDLSWHSTAMSTPCSRVCLTGKAGEVLQNGGTVSTTGRVLRGSMILDHGITCAVT